MISFDEVACLCGAQLQIGEIPIGDAPARVETAYCPVCNRSLCDVEVEGLLVVVIITRQRNLFGPSMVPASRPVRGRL
jgi:hypothetical protein